MIEVSLYSIPTKDANASVGKCVDRARVDHDQFGGGVLKFVKSFLKTNIPAFELAVNNPGLISIINGDDTWTVKDLASINFWLIQAGYIVKIQNVTDDEENVNGPADGTVEWNIVDYNFMQFGYPTATKIIPAPGADVAKTLRRVVEVTGLFPSDRFIDVKNPFTELLENLDKVKDLTGGISSTITTKIYEYLDQVGFKVFVAAS